MLFVLSVANCSCQPFFLLQLIIKQRKVWCCLLQLSTFLSFTAKLFKKGWPFTAVNITIESCFSPHEEIIAIKYGKNHFLLFKMVEQKEEWAQQQITGICLQLLYISMCNCVIGGCILSAAFFTNRVYKSSHRVPVMTPWVWSGPFSLLLGHFETGSH